MTAESKLSRKQDREIQEPGWYLRRLLDWTYGSHELQKMEFLTEFYHISGLYRYRDKIVIFDTKLAQTAINKMEKGAENELDHSPLKETVLGSSKKSPEVRRTIATIFRKDVIEEKGQLLIKDVDNLIRKMSNNICSPVNITAWSLRFAIDVLGHLILQLDLNALEGQQDKLIEALTTILHDCYALGSITTTSEEYVQANENLDSRTEKILQDALQTEAEKGETRLLKELNDVCGFDSAKENIKLLLMSGSQTTASVLSVAFFLLATRPEIQSVLQREADENIVKLREDPTHTVPQIESMMKEVLRLYPIAPFISHRCHQTITLGPYYLDAKSDLIIFTWGIHRSAHLWSDSKEFCPFRFLDVTSGEQNNMFIPFGGGSSVCVGQHLAWLELKLVITMLLNRYTFLKVPETPELDIVVDWEHAGVRPDKDMYFKIRTR